MTTPHLTPSLLARLQAFCLRHGLNIQYFVNQAVQSELNSALRDSSVLVMIMKSGPRRVRRAARPLLGSAQYSPMTTLRLAPALRAQLQSFCSRYGINPHHFVNQAVKCELDSALRDPSLLAVIVKASPARCRRKPR